MPAVCARRSVDLRRSGHACVKTTGIEPERCQVRMPWKANPRCDADPPRPLPNGRGHEGPLIARRPHLIEHRFVYITNRSVRIGDCRTGPAQLAFNRRLTVPQFPGDSDSVWVPIPKV